jgi:hypothetical protein
VSGRQAERVVVGSMRLLAVAFAVVGILFLATPDGVVETIDDVGDGLGDFAPGAGSEQKLWLGLAFAYMVVITGLALTVQADVVRFRPLLLVLAAGKAASSLAAGAYFVFDQDVFVYLVNFVVDGSLVAVALGCWALAGRVEAPGPPARQAAGVPPTGRAGGDGGARAPAPEVPAPPG